MEGVIKINEFFGGLSDTSTRLGLGQTPYAENIDFRRDPEYIQLSRAYQDSFSTGSNLMLCALDEKKYSRSFYAGENGTIYADDGTLVYTLTGGQDIINSIKFGSRYIFLYESGGLMYIMTIDVANANYTGWNPLDVNEDFGIYPGAHYESSGYLLALNDSDDFLYITAGQNVIRLDISGVISEGLTLEDDITGMTRHGGIYRLYTRNGMLYAWDGFSLQHEGYTHLNTYVRYVFNNSGIDYIVGGTTGIYSNLYYAQGFGKQTLKKAINVGGNEMYMYDIANVGGNYTMAEFDGIVYLTDTDHGRIESLGKEYIGYPTSYCIDNIITDFNNIGMIYRENRSPFLYFSYKDSFNNAHIARIDKGSTGPYTYMQDGILYSEKYSFDHVMRKQGEEINIRADTPVNTSIDIEYSIDGGVRANLYTLTNTDKRERLPANLIQEYFYEIQFRFLLHTTDANTTPKLYDVSTKFKEIQD